MYYRFTQPIPADELEAEFQGIGRMLHDDGLGCLSNLVIAFDCEHPPVWRVGPPQPAIRGYLVEFRVKDFQWPRAKRTAALANKSASRGRAR